MKRPLIWELNKKLDLPTDNDMKSRERFAILIKEQLD